MLSGITANQEKTIYIHIDFRFYSTAHKACTFFYRDRKTFYITSVLFEERRDFVVFYCCRYEKKPNELQGIRFINALSSKLKP